jgi:ABC-type multidrug transport system ATPase subunit
MGPSGSGKTSLLSIMGARAQRSMKVEGRVLFNGAPLTKRLRRSVGYVMQDDLLYAALTVFETLHYAAQLRLPRKMSAEDKKKRVETVVRALGLEKCKDTIIGETLLVLSHLFSSLLQSAY